MTTFVLAIYLLSLGIQLHSLFLVRNIIIQYQKHWIGNIMLIISLIIISIHHIFYFFQNFNQAKVVITESFFMLSNSLIFYAIILFIGLITRHLGDKSQWLAYKLRFDSLTKTLSREEILIQCERELVRAIRSGESVSLLTIDIDNFKTINDTYGHSIGDEVLIRSANYCKELLREIDLIGRIGGDEFIVLLPNTNIKSAHEVANRILRKMRGLVNELSIHTDNPINLSIGVAGFNLRELKKSQRLFNSRRHLKKLIDSSDRALYEAKKSGKNQCMINSDNKYIFKME